MPGDDSDRSDAHSDPSPSLVPSSLLTSSSDRTTVEAAGSSLDLHFPGYTLLAELNRGGQGIVYQAIQAGTNRKVAIKISLDRAGPDDATTRRFEREVELVGRLAHPNIISVFHSGRTPDGRDFFVMDYVRGSSLTRYVRERRLTLTEALELFARVCDGVQFAHQRGIIHRDLKPSNILVQETPAEHAREADGDERILGTPRILDFGLAKWMMAPAGPPISRSYVLVGTLPYMAPEQVRGNPDEIDTRTDIYALGLILYELLTGSPPYPVRGNTDDVMRNITSMEPTPPSRAWKPDAGVAASRSSRTGSGRPTRTASLLRRFSLRRVRPLRSPIDDEVQTIVLKALAKERERRYQSTAELGNDIRHYLAGEPIDAKRDSGLYLLRKTLRRYRVHATIVAVFVALQAVGLVGMYFSFERQRAGRVLAESSRADAERDRARAESEKSLAALNFMQEVFAAADPADATGRRDITVPELLNRAVEYIDKLVGAKSPGTDPAVRRAQESVWADQRTIVGRLMSQRGLYAKAERQLRLALEMREQIPETTQADLAISHSDVGRVLFDQGRVAEAEPFYRRALKIRETTMPPDDPDIATAQVDLASFLKQTGRLPEAVQILRRAAAVHQEHSGPEHKRTLEARNELAMALVSLGDSDEAEPMLRDLLAIKQKQVGQEHRDTGVAWQNLGLALRALGKLDQAEEAFSRAVAILRKTLGDKHVFLGGALNDLGLTLRELHRPTEAETVFREAVDIHLQPNSEYSREAVAPLHNLALALRDQGKTAEAIQNLRQAIGILADDDAPDRGMIAHVKITLGATLVEAGECDSAEPLLLDNYNGPVGLVTRDVALRKLVELYEATSRPEHAARFRAMQTPSSDTPATGPASQPAIDR